MKGYSSVNRVMAILTQGLPFSITEKKILFEIIRGLGLAVSSLTEGSKASLAMKGYSSINRFIAILNQGLPYSII